MAEVDEAVQIIGVDAPSVQVESDVVTSPSRGLSKLLAVIGVVVIGLVLWSLLAPTGSNDVDSAPAETAQTESAPTNDPVAGPATGSTESGAGAETGAGSQAGPGGAAPPAEPGGDDVGGLPVLDESGALVGSDLVAPSAGPVIPGSEYSIFVNDASGELVVLDLATGAVSEHRVLGGRLLADTDGVFVFRDLAGGFVKLVPADDLDDLGTRVVAPDPYRSALAAAPAGDGLLTVLAADIDGRWVDFAEVIIDIDTGEVLSTTSIELRQDLVPPGYAANPDVLTSPTGGVYVRDGPGRADYRRVLDGRVLVADERYALVQTCDAQLQCVREWHDVATWRAVTRPQPEVAFDTGVLWGGGRILVYAVPGTSTLEMFDVEQNVTLPVSFDRGTPGVSPDGSLVAYFDVESAELVVFDTDTSLETRVDLESNAGSVAFVRLP